MLFLLAIVFVLCYTIHQAVGIAVVCLTTALAVLWRTWHGAGVRVNRKDAVYAAYAAAALAPTIRHGGMYETAFYCGIVLYPWLVSFLFQNMTIDWPRVTGWSLLTTAIACGTVAVLLFQVAPGQFDISLERLVTLDRNRGFVYRGDRTGPNKAASMALAGFAVILALLKFRRLPFMVGVPVLATLSVLLMIAGGRIASLSASVLILIYGVTAFQGGLRQRGRQLAGAAALMIVLAPGAVLTYRTLNATHGERFQERVEGVTNPLEDRSLLVRLEDWSRAAEMIRGDPWGLGFNAYYASYGRTPHNELLGQWIGGGWVGAALYVCLIVYLVIRSWSVVMYRLTCTTEGFTHYVLLSLLSAACLVMLTEHITRGGLSTFYPIVWMAVGLSYAAPKYPAAGRGGTIGVTGGPGRDLAFEVRMP